MRGPLPLSDADFAEVRAAVLAKIVRRRAPWAELVALAASVAIAVSSMVMARRPMPSPGPSGHPLPLTRAREIATSAPLPRAGEGAAKRRVRVAHHRKPLHTQVARIELHTADPDIRIIWITN